MQAFEFAFSVPTAEACEVQPDTTSSTGRNIKPLVQRFLNYCLHLKTKHTDVFQHQFDLGMEFRMQYLW